MNKEASQDSPTIVNDGPFDIIVRFPNETMAKEFCGQMSDGFGEGFCDFSFWQQKPGTTGTKKEDFQPVWDERGRRVYFVNSITKF